MLFFDKLRNAENGIVVARSAIRKMAPVTPFSTGQQLFRNACGVVASQSGVQKGLVIMTSYFDASIGDEQQFRVALSKGGMTLELMKYVGNKGELGKIMVDALKAHVEAEACKAETFENEQVESTYEYPPGWKLKTLSEQAAILAERFPGLDVSHVDEIAARYCVDDVSGDATGSYRDAPKKGKRLVLPKGMDGLVVIPKSSVIARLVRERDEKLKVGADLSWPDENLALAEIINVISKARSCTERSVGPKRYKLTEKTKKAYAAFDNLPGDIMVLAVQTGFLHRGKSVRRARFVFGEREFGLCAFAVGIILLTHPERLTYDDHLWIDCAGSESTPLAGGDFCVVPCFSFDNGSLKFRFSNACIPDSRYGSASFVLTECQS